MSITVGLACICWWQKLKNQIEVLYACLLAPVSGEHRKPIPRTWKMFLLRCHNIVSVLRGSPTGLATQSWQVECICCIDTIVPAKNNVATLGRKSLNFQQNTVCSSARKHLTPRLGEWCSTPRQSMYDTTHSDTRHLSCTQWPAQPNQEAPLPVAASSDGVSCCEHNSAHFTLHHQQVVTVSYLQLLSLPEITVPCHFKNFYLS